MKTLTIRGIDPELNNKMKEWAISRGQSINMMVLQLLERAFGMEEKKTFPIYHDLDHLAGTWTEDDEKEFHHNIRSLDQVETELWK